MMEEGQERALKELAADIRIGTLRSMAFAGGGHLGGSMSIADVLAVLYGAVMKYDPEKPRWEGRDRLVLSKGHCGPALYTALAKSGFFPEETLATLNRPGTSLPSHADRRRTPGVDMSTGSLGQGASVASGMAYALKIRGNPARVYTILGDGELQEGQPWECFQFVSHQKLSNLTILIDHNHRQLDDLLVNICDPFDLAAKFGAFGLSAFVAKGYDVADVYGKIMQANGTEGAGVVILDTVKGIGCSFSEDADFNHFMNFDMEQAKACAREIKARLEKGIVGKEA